MPGKQYRPSNVIISPFHPHRCKPAPVRGRSARLRYHQMNLCSNNKLH
jgi:hypothetical protein